MSKRINRRTWSDSDIINAIVVRRERGESDRPYKREAVRRWGSAKRVEEVVHCEVVARDIERLRDERDAAREQAKREAA